MQLRTIEISSYRYENNFGSFDFCDVQILFDPEVKDLTLQNFNQYEDEFFLSSDQINNLSHRAAIRFYNSRAQEILLGVSPLTLAEVKGIRDFLGVSGAGLGLLIGMDKSSISRVLNGKQPLMQDKARSLLNLLREEINGPGYNKIILSRLKGGDKNEKILELKINALDIAQYFIEKFESLESPITQLKLQKLLYYAQGIALGRYNIKLFREPLLAWKHGPVVNTIYEHYKQFGKNVLPTHFYTPLDKEVLNSVVIKILEETIALYGIYDAWVLRTKTHNEMPWLETSRGDIISDEKMTTFFSNLLV